MLLSCFLLGVLLSICSVFHSSYIAWRTEVAYDSQNYDFSCLADSSVTANEQIMDAVSLQGVSSSQNVRYKNHEYSIVLLDQPNVLLNDFEEGRMPQSSDEIVISHEFSRYRNLKCNETITFTVNGEEKDYVISGIGTNKVYPLISLLPEEQQENPDLLYFRLDDNQPVQETIDAINSQINSMVNWNYNAIAWQYLDPAGLAQWMQTNPAALFLNNNLVWICSLFVAAAAFCLFYQQRKADQKDDEALFLNGKTRRSILTMHFLRYFVFGLASGTAGILAGTGLAWIFFEVFKALRSFLGWPAIPVFSYTWGKLAGVIVLLGVLFLAAWLLSEIHLRRSLGKHRDIQKIQQLSQKSIFSNPCTLKTAGFAFLSTLTVVAMAFAMLSVLPNLNSLDGRKMIFHSNEIVDNYEQLSARENEIESAMEQEEGEFSLETILYANAIQEGSVDSLYFPVEVIDDNSWAQYKEQENVEAEADAVFFTDLQPGLITTEILIDSLIDPAQPASGKAEIISQFGTGKHFIQVENRPALEDQETDQKMVMSRSMLSSLMENTPCLFYNVAFEVEFPERLSSQTQDEIWQTFSTDSVKTAWFNNAWDSVNAQYWTAAAMALFLAVWLLLLGAVIIFIVPVLYGMFLENQKADDAVLIQMGMTAPDQKKKSRLEKAALFVLPASTAVLIWFLMWLLYLRFL